MPEQYRPQPYLGISGVASVEQHVDLFVIAAYEEIKELGYFMMIGVQATGKTQVLDIPNKYGVQWHPVGDEISYAAWDEDTTSITKAFVHVFFDPETEMKPGIKNVMRRTKNFVQGMQFNGLDWIGEDYRTLLHDFRRDYPNKAIIMQANKKMLDNHTPAEMADKLESLRADYVLLDPSGGQGLELNPRKLIPFIDEIYQRQLLVGVGIAGGLSAQNIERIFGPLTEKYPRLSCDAEGRLRKGSKGYTTLDIKAAAFFVQAWKNSVIAAENH